MAQTRNTETNERFVAFAFAGAEIMAESEPGGTITYAAGAFQNRFGRPAETFVGNKLASLVAPADQEALEMALAMLTQRGRLNPMMVRLADSARTPLALAGILLPGQGGPDRLCLTFARPPEQSSTLLRPLGAQSFTRTTQARLREGACQQVHLLEIKASGEDGEPDMTRLGEAIHAISPDAHAGELSPGRYGLLGSDEALLDLLATPGALEAALREKGVQAAVTATSLNLASHGLTPAQATRALRMALTSFARGGARALNEAGFGKDLAGHIQRAGRKAEILNRVIRDGKFNLLFQPIVTLADRSPHHYEALIRPRPIPELPLSGPQEFVMLTEAVGLADDLDMRIAALTCDHAAEAGLQIGFNISGQSAQNPAFRGRLIRLLEAHQAVRAGWVMVEMTETAEIEDVAEALLTAQALRQIGVAFCLDDFGAGAADLRLLHALTPNIVKLDGSYIPGIANPGRERAFIGGMVEIARATGAEMVAERIETEAEAAILTSLGVQYGQGWLFGRPEALPKRRATKRAGEKAEPRLK